MNVIDCCLDIIGDLRIEDDYLTTRKKYVNSDISFSLLLTVVHNTHLIETSKHILYLQTMCDYLLEWTSFVLHFNIFHYAFRQNEVSNMCVRKLCIQTTQAMQERKYMYLMYLYRICKNYHTGRHIYSFILG